MMVNIKLFILTIPRWYCL